MASVDDELLLLEDPDLENLDFRRWGGESLRL